MLFVFLLDDLGEDCEGERKVESQLEIHWFIYMFNKQCLPDVVVPTCNFSTWRLMQKDREFKTIPGYRPWLKM